MKTQLFLSKKNKGEFIKFSIKISNLILLLNCFYSNTVFAQYNTEFLNYRNTGRSICSDFSIDAGSNGMSNILANKLIWGGYINSEIKKQSSQHLNKQNNLGINLNYNISAFYKGNEKFDYLIGIKNQEIINSTYSQDLFNLTFYGNQSFKNKSADLGNCNFNSLKFQEIKFGAMMHKVDTIGKIGISVSFIKGENLFYLNTNELSSLYTSVDGSEITFNSNFNMALSDATNNNLISFNGMGASADIFFETPYKSKLGKKSILTVSANNIGFIHWNNKSIQYSSDSSLHFIGYKINNLNDLKDSTINRLNKDSLLRNLSNERLEGFNMNIPTNLILINKIYFGKELFSLSTGFRYIFNANYKPYLFIEPEYKLKNLTFTLHTGYGGYVRFNIGASIILNTENWFIKIGSNSLQGFILPKSVFAQALYLSFAKKFK